MRVNFKEPFRDLFGEPIKDREGKELEIGKTLGLELFNLADLNKVPLTQEQKYMAYTLSVKIANADGEVEISEKEAKFIDHVASAVFKAGAYGNVVRVLERGA